MHNTCQNNFGKSLNYVQTIYFDNVFCQ